MKKVITILVVLTLLAGGWFVLRQYGAQYLPAALSDLDTIPAERGDIDATIGATGFVRSNQSAILTWRTSGTVAVVNVKAGDNVTTGQVLAVLGQASLPPNIILAQANLITAQNALDDLLNSQLQQAQALRAVEEARQAFEDLFNSELNQAITLEAIADAQKEVEDVDRAVKILTNPVPQTAIDQAHANMLLAENALNIVRSDVERIERKLEKPERTYAFWESRSLYKKILQGMQIKLTQRQIAYDNAVFKLNDLQTPVNPNDLAVGKAGLETAQAQLLQAEREWERLKDGPSPAEVALLEAQLADAQRQWERLQDGPDPADIAAAEARIAAAQAALDQDRITATFDGVLTDVISKPGDQANPGTLALRLDDLSRLLVDVQVSEVDINQIQVGQPVILTFEAILAAEYHGEVVEVSSVGEIQQGVVNFKATVELTDIDERVKPGMTAAVNVVINQLDDVLLVPNRAVRIKDGKRVVYVLRTGTPEAVEIELGASSETVSEVLGGDLQVGDQIVLNPPTTFEQSGHPPFIGR